jgi:4-hydroxybutyrate dehydrogenase
MPDDGPAFVLRSPFLVPRVAICDPTLTLDLPAQLTAGTGMDALSHCIETYVATAYNPPADGIALDGLRRVIANIERAVAHGSDLDARREMMAARSTGRWPCRRASAASTPCPTRSAPWPATTSTTAR